MISTTMKGRGRKAAVLAAMQAAKAAEAARLADCHEPAPKTPGVRCGLKRGHGGLHEWRSGEYGVSWR